MARRCEGGLKTNRGQWVLSSSQVLSKALKGLQRKSQTFLSQSEAREAIFDDGSAKQH